MINCSEAVKKLWDYVENDLDVVDQGKMEEHLAFCRRCCGEVEFTQELRSMMHSSAKPHVPEEAKERLERFVDDLGQGSEPSPS